MSEIVFPLFPLDLVLYPEEELPLHIFELRYREMVEFCLESDSPFGVVLNQDGDLSDVGCSARIEQIVESYEDGRKDILVYGLHRIRVKKVSDTRSYLTGDIEILAEIEQAIDIHLRERVIAQHIKLLELAGRMPAPTSYQNRSFLSFFIAHNAGLSLDQKQKILEMGGEADRLEFLVEHLEQFLPMVEEVESVRMKVLSNGHFKDFPPGLTK